MGIRVRKLARELRRSSGEVLGLLQQLGYERYRNPEDMVSDSVAVRIRKESRKNGVPAVPAAPAASPPPARRAQQNGAGDAGDLMAQLVPGVRRAAKGVAPVPTPKAPSAPQQAHEVAASSAAEAVSEAPAAAASTGGDLAVRWAELREAEATLAKEREALAAERQQVEVDRRALAVDRTTLAEQRAAHEAQKPLGALTSVPNPEASLEDPSGDPDAAPADSSMMAMFDGRGLKGIDEAERALAALAGARALGRVLEQVKVREPDLLKRLLWERLVLVGGPDVPEELDVPSVIVSKDRADIPGAFELSRRCATLGEQLMLSGLTRVVLVGLSRRWHSLLRARFDPRISLAFRPGPLTASQLVVSRDPRRLTVAASGSEGHERSTSGGGHGAPSSPAAPILSAGDPIDAILLQADNPVDPDLAAAVAESRTELHAIPATDLASWLEQAAHALSRSA